jgi:hypothetical protein
VQTTAKSCSPETLRRLQTIFNAVWRKLEQQQGSHTFPWAIEATRFTIAHLILERVNDLRDAARIEREVLASIAATGEPERRKAKRLAGKTGPHRSN